MQRIQSRKLSDVITEQLESMIIEGQLLAGQKLPPERQLAESFAVSRPSLREAIQNLEAKGLLTRKQGGGTFVKQNLTAAFTDPLLALIGQRPETQFDLLEFRHALEGMAAYYAALRGQAEDYQKLQAALQKTVDVTPSKDKSSEAEALVEFYHTMALASHNLVLLHIMRSLKVMLQDNIRANLQMLANSTEGALSSIHSQRQHIVSAILARDPELARQASNEHLAFIEDTLLNINRQDLSIQRAIRRIEVKK